MNSSRRSPSRSLPLFLLEALNVFGSPSLHYRVSEETCRLCPKLCKKKQNNFLIHSEKAQTEGETVYVPRQLSKWIVF